MRVVEVVDLHLSTRGMRVVRRRRVMCIEERLGEVQLGYSVVGFDGHTSVRLTLVVIVRTSARGRSGATALCHRRADLAIDC